MGAEATYACINNQYQIFSSIPRWVLVKATISISIHWQLWQKLAALEKWLSVNTRISKSGALIFWSNSGKAWLLYLFKAFIRFRWYIMYTVEILSSYSFLPVSDSPVVREQCRPSYTSCLSRNSPRRLSVSWMRSIRVWILATSVWFMNRLCVEPPSLVPASKYPSFAHSLPCMRQLTLAPLDISWSRQSYCLIYTTLIKCACSVFTMESGSLANWNPSHTTLKDTDHLEEKL